MTDIASIVAAPRTIDIKHPATGANVGLKITLLPTSSDQVQAAQRKLINDRLQRDVKTSAERLEENRLSMIEAAVGGWEWEGDLTFEGEKPEFSPAFLRKVLKLLPWVREQIDMELGNDAAFFAHLANS